MLEPPERIDGGIVVLRRCTEADAVALLDAVSASLAELRPWMPWAAVVPTLDDQRALLRHWRTTWELGTDHHYALEEPGTGPGAPLLGTLGLHDRRGPGSREIGYWVRSDRTGRGLATAAAAAATRAWLALPGVDAIEICHDAANLRSGRVPARLGFTHVGDEQREVLAPGEVGVHRVWRCTRAEDLLV